ncbi:MAG TPA: hypothetical protein VJ719_15305 [Chthoniobacterales bacterium]|nr:hypothetical protein [Chthoniobacterales bacterium]
MNSFVLGLIVNAGLVLAVSGLLYLKREFWDAAKQRRHLVADPVSG